MTGYTKLFSSIVHSTIWREENETRLVWITMLAIADKHGEVQASIPGLADLSRVTIDECIDALNKLSSPDPYSRSKEYNGRRIEEIDGGWILLNHAKYREKMSEEDRREKNRIRQARYRSRNICHDSVTKSNNVTPHTEANTKAKAEAAPDSEVSSSKEKNIYQSTEFLEFWSAYPKRVAKGAAAKALKSVIKEGQYQQMIDGLKQYQFPKDKQYIPNPATWLNQRRWEDELEQARQYEPQPQIKYTA